MPPGAQPDAGPPGGGPPTGAAPPSPMGGVNPMAMMLANLAGKGRKRPKSRAHAKRGGGKRKRGK